MYPNNYCIEMLKKLVDSIVRIHKSVFKYYIKLEN